jgi:uncharacterized membrane protein
MTRMGTTVDLPGADTAPPLNRARPARLAARLPGRWPHLLLGAGFCAAWTVLSVARYLRFGAQEWDLAIFTQGVRGYAHLGAPVSDIKGPGFSLLGDHFSPIIATLAPVYRVFPSAVTLLVAQTVLFGVSVVVVSSTAEQLTTRAKGLAVGTAYGLSWGLQRAVDADFHEIAFAVPIIAVVARQLLLRRWNRAAWWSLPLLLVKEDMGLTVAAVGVLLLCNRRWQSGALLVSGGAAAVSVIVYRVIPWFSPSHHYAYFSALPGGSAVHAQLGSMLLGLVWPVVKWRTVAWIVGITGLLCLRSPLMVLALPTLAWRFASSDQSYWGTAWHYSAVLMPVVFLAAVDGMVRLERAGPSWARNYARQGVPLMVGAAVAISAGMSLTLSELADPATYGGGAHAAALRAADRLIPDGATVETGNPQLAALASRCTVFWPGGDPVAPQYITLDLSWWSPGMTPVAYAEMAHRGSVYVQTFDQQQVVVVRRVG